MGQDPGKGGASVTGSQDPEALQRNIDATRRELGDTVEALAERADVKAQARQKVETAKELVKAKKEQLLGSAREASPGAATSVTQASHKAREHPLPVAAVGAFVAGFLVGRTRKR